MSGRRKFSPHGAARGQPDIPLIKKSKSDQNLTATSSEFKPKPLDHFPRT